MAIIPPSRPKRDKADVAAILEHHKIALSKACLVFIRGYYLDSMGKRGQNDINVYDDAAFLISPKIFESYNANTDPSFIIRDGRALAKLNLGVYQFYRGLHKGRYPALRAYPEGVVLDCTRNGQPSKCSAINIHKGGTVNGRSGVTWSEGCLTIPAIQYPDWKARVWREMDAFKQHEITVILVENRQTANGHQLFDAAGKII